MEHRSPGPSEKDKALQKSRLKEKQQVVAGFVVFRRTEDGVKYLLLYRRGNYWNFPKGHFEAGEQSMAAALRETEEETGIKPSELRIIPGFKALERFHFRAGDERIHDTVILYLAETRQANVRISPREHSGFAWFLYHDAIAILGKKYVGTRRVLKQAQDFMRHRRGQTRTDSRTDADRRRHPHSQHDRQHGK
jgi:8-oxo-dGTP pyrophosphatase MutT (NUDIX family)